MNVSDRISRILYVNAKDLILCADIRGRIHLFDRDLNLIKSSPSTEYTNMINSITYDEKYVFTKDTTGVIGKWDIHSLRPIDFHDSYSLREETFLASSDEVPSPSNSRGIAVYNGKLYTNNGYTQFVIIDVETFEVIAIHPPFSVNSAVDCISAENSDVHAISETCGMVHLGSLDTLKFDTKIAIDNASVHIIRFDKRHNRFIASQDVGLNEDRNVKNGIVTFDCDGSNKKNYSFTNDDVEFILFSDDFKTIYTGGFDGSLYIFDNTDTELKLKHVTKPFDHQLIGAVNVENDMYLLMQSGEMVKTNLNGEILKKIQFDYKCVWSLEKHPNNEKMIYCASGRSVDIFEYSSAPYNSVRINRMKKHAHLFGIIFRVCPLADSSYLALSRDNTVFKADIEGNILWYTRLEDLPKNLAVSSDGKLALVGLNNGLVYELNAESGEIITRKTFHTSVYVTGYVKGMKVVGTKEGDISFYDNDFEKVNEINLDGYPKRILEYNQKHYITGSFGMVELDLDNFQGVKTFIESLWNTKENGVVIGDSVFVISYGKQVGAYNYHDQELVDLVEPLYDYPKGITGTAADDVLLVGGNGGYIHAYRIVEGTLYKVREFYI